MRKIKETVIPLVGEDGNREKTELLNSYFAPVVSQKEKEVNYQVCHGGGGGGQKRSEGQNRQISGERNSSLNEFKSLSQMDYIPGC